MKIKDLASDSELNNEEKKIFQEILEIMIIINYKKNRLYPKYFQETSLIQGEIELSAKKYYDERLIINKLKQFDESILIKIYHSFSLTKTTRKSWSNIVNPIFSLTNISVFLTLFLTFLGSQFYFFSQQSLMIYLIGGLGNFLLAYIIASVILSIPIKLFQELNHKKNYITGLLEIALNEMREENKDIQILSKYKIPKRNKTRATIEFDSF